MPAAGAKAIAGAVEAAGLGSLVGAVAVLDPLGNQGAGPLFSGDGARPAGARALGLAADAVDAEVALALGWVGAGGTVDLRPGAGGQLGLHLDQRAPDQVGVDLGGAHHAFLGEGAHLAAHVGAAQVIGEVEDHVRAAGQSVGGIGPPLRRHQGVALLGLGDAELQLIDVDVAPERDEAQGGHLDRGAAAARDQGGHHQRQAHAGLSTPRR